MMVHIKCCCFNLSEKKQILYDLNDIFSIQIHVHLFLKLYYTFCSIESVYKIDYTSIKIFEKILRDQGYV